MDYSVGIFFLLWIHCVHACTSYSKGYKCIDVVPQTAIVEVGQPFHFDCVLNQTCFENEVYDPSQIYFISNSKNYTNRQLEVIDRYRIRLTISNATLKHNSAYYCKVCSNCKHKEIHCPSDAIVGFKPLKVQNLFCEYFLYKQMECKWNTSFNPVETNYSLTYFSKNEKTLGSKCKNLNSCIWKYGLDHIDEDQFYFELNGSNKLGEISQSFVFDLHSIVVASPPENLSFSHDELKWNDPSDIINFNKADSFSQSIDLIYEVDIYETDNDKEVLVSFVYGHVVGMSHNISFDHKPYTNYTMKVRCKVNYSDNEYWSDYASITGLTRPNIPLVPPELIEQSFESVFTNSSNKRTVTIYWHDINESMKNGPNFGYSLFYAKNSDLKNWTNKSTFYTNYTFENLDNVSYSFRIFSQNSVGRSKNFTTFFLPSSEKLLSTEKSIRIYSLSNGTYSIKWNNHQNWNYTVFWCISKFGQCYKEIHWYNTTEAHYKLKLKFGEDYRFGLSVKNASNSISGIAWAECQFENNKIKGLDVLTSYMTTPNSITIKWLFNCFAQDLENVTIKYCQMENCKTKKAKASDGEFMLTDLVSETKYEVSLSLPNGKEHKFEVQTDLQTDKTPLFTILIVIALCVIIFCIYSITKCWFRIQKKNKNFNIQIMCHDMNKLKEFENHPETEKIIQLEQFDPIKIKSNSITNTSTISDTSSAENSHSTDKNYSSSDNICSSDSGVNEVISKDNREYYVNEGDYINDDQCITDDCSRPFLYNHSRQASIQPAMISPRIENTYHSTEQPHHPSPTMPSNGYVSLSEIENKNHLPPFSSMLN